VSDFILGLLVFLDEKNLTDWFSSANVSEAMDRDRLTITKEQLQSVSVTFQSGKYCHTLFSDLCQLIFCQTIPDCTFVTVVTWFYRLFVLSFVVTVFVICVSIIFISVVSKNQVLCLLSECTVFGICVLSVCHLCLCNCRLTAVNSVLSVFVM